MNFFETCYRSMKNTMQMKSSLWIGQNIPRKLTIKCLVIIFINQIINEVQIINFYTKVKIGMVDNKVRRHTRPHSMWLKV